MGLRRRRLLRSNRGGIGAEKETTEPWGTPVAIIV